MNVPFKHTWAVNNCYMVEGAIRKALRSCKSDVTFEDIVAKVRSGELLWFNVDDPFAFTLASINELTPTVYNLHLHISGGSVEGLAMLEEDMLIPFAKQMGLRKMTSLSRPGVVKHKWSDGWHSPCVYMEKEIV